MEALSFVFIHDWVNYRIAVQSVINLNKLMDINKKIIADNIKNSIADVVDEWKFPNIY